MRSRAVKRIEDAAMLRSNQMPGWLASSPPHCTVSSTIPSTNPIQCHAEDEGPMSHPIRPDSVQKFDVRSAVTLPLEPS